MNSNDYNLPALLENYDRIIFDTSALNIMPANPSTVGFKLDPPIQKTMQYMQFLMGLFKKDVDNKLVVLEEVLREFRPNDKKYHKNTEKKWGLIFNKRRLLVDLIKKTHPSPKLDGIEKELLSEYREKYCFLKQEFSLSPADFSILMYSLIMSMDKKCALLTNDSGIIKAQQDLMAIRNSPEQHTGVFDVYTMIGSEEFRKSYTIQKA